MTEERNITGWFGFLILILAFPALLLFQQWYESFPEPAGARQINPANSIIANQLWRAQGLTAPQLGRNRGIQIGDVFIISGATVDMDLNAAYEAVWTIQNFSNTDIVRWPTKETGE